MKTREEVRQAILANLPNKPTALLEILCPFVEAQIKEELSQMMAEDKLELTPDRIIRLKERSVSRGQ